MAEPPSPCPNPRRVEAGRRNRAKRLGLSSDGRERLRQAALASRPWEHATGPRTTEGKTRAARNGRAHRKVEKSAREIEAELAGVMALLRGMAAARHGLRRRHADDAPIAG